jgi:hypothetical protein
MPQHIAWVEIESFYNVRKLLANYPELARGKSTVTYRAKIKLHGTNAGVMVGPDGVVTAISRSAILTPTSDNAGFAKWVAEREKAFAAFASDKATVVIFGEWCGPGIQKGVAVNQVKDRMLAVFALRLVAPSPGLAPLENFIAEPLALAGIARTVPGAYVIPWFNSGEEFQVDWNETPERLQPTLDRINAHVARVEECDPWMASQFGVRGVGEGLVFYPVDSQHLGYENFSNLCFKAKGEKHQVVAKTKPVQADPTVVASLAAFAELVVTPARLDQGVRAVNGGELKFDSKNIGAFLGWISKDILKETTAELEVSGLEQKAATQACSNRARTWYISEMKKL